MERSMKFLPLYMVVLFTEGKDKLSRPNKILYQSLVYTAPAVIKDIYGSTRRHTRHKLGASYLCLTPGNSKKESDWLIFGNIRLLIKLTAK